MHIFTVAISGSVEQHYERFVSWTDSIKITHIYMQNYTPSRRKMKSEKEKKYVDDIIDLTGEVDLNDSGGAVKSIDTPSSDNSMGNKMR